MVRRAKGGACIQEEDLEAVICRIRHALPGGRRCRDWAGQRYRGRIVQRTARTPVRSACAPCGSHLQCAPRPGLAVYMPRGIRPSKAARHLSRMCTRRRAAAQSARCGRLAVGAGGPLGCGCLVALVRARWMSTATEAVADPSDIV